MDLAAFNAEEAARQTRHDKATVWVEGDIETRRITVEIVPVGVTVTFNISESLRLAQCLLDEAERIQHKQP